MQIAFPKFAHASKKKYQKKPKPLPYQCIASSTFLLYSTLSFFVIVLVLVVGSATFYTL